MSPTRCIIHTKSYDFSLSAAPEEIARLNSLISLRAFGDGVGTKVVPPSLNRLSAKCDLACRR
jgi:hypothetical protein